MNETTKNDIIVLPETDSTNTRLKELARQGAAHGTAILALRQNAGRGRLGRGFISPEKGLYMSVLLRPECAAERIPTLTPCAALAVCGALESFCGVSTEIKWPNDVLVGGKKLCGILTEGVAGADGRLAAVVGIGINVNTRSADFPEELRESVCTMLDLTGRETDVAGLARAVRDELETVYGRWSAGDALLVDEYRALCVNIGRDICVLRDGAARAARALDMGDDFSLLAGYEDGSRERIRFGEVSIRSRS